MHIYPSVTINGLSKMTRRQYKTLLEQAFNLKNFDINGKLEKETYKDKQLRAAQELKELKTKGKF